MRIVADGIIVDFIRDEVDVAIRYGQGRWDGLEAHKLFSEDYFPVCSPDLAWRLREPADLSHHTLLHESDLLVDWRSWLDAAGVRTVDAGRGPIFNHGGMMVAAAIAGQGVAMGRTPLVDDELRIGRLVRPFDISVPGANAHYLVYPSSHAHKPMIVAFRDWLLDEALARADASDLSAPDGACAD